MSDDLTPDVVPYSAFLERRERRQRIAEALGRKPLAAVVEDEPPDEPPVSTAQACRIERPRGRWREC
jgi:hypothetical protein